METLLTLLLSSAASTSSSTKNGAGWKLQHGELTASQKPAQGCENQHAPVDGEEKGERGDSFLAA